MTTETAVFVDYDGTITDLDTFDVLVRTFAGARFWEELERKLEAGTMTLREVLSAQAEHIRVSLDQADEVLRAQTRFDPAFGSFVASCEARAITVTVLSSGVQALIERAFARNGLKQVRILANGIEPHREGWRFIFRDDSDNGHDKASAVRAARDAGMRTLFIGDGPSDYDAAIAADERFAKAGRGLERYLAQRAIPFTVFHGFGEIEAAVCQDQRP